MLACHECGAEWPEGQSCQDIFDEFLVLEFQDREYGAVHFLTVATYMTQHGRYTDEAQAWIREKLRENLEESASVEWIRRAANQPTSQAKRTWKVVRPPGAPPPKKIAWEMTIVDVARQHDLSGHGAASYCALVTEWARSTLRQLEGA